MQPPKRKNGRASRTRDTFVFPMRPRDGNLRSSLLKNHKRFFDFRPIFHLSPLDSAKVTEYNEPINFKEVRSNDVPVQISAEYRSYRCVCVRTGRLCCNGVCLLGRLRYRHPLHRHGHLGCVFFHAYGAYYCSFYWHDRPPLRHFHDSGACMEPGKHFPCTGWTARRKQRHIGKPCGGLIPHRQTDAALLFAEAAFFIAFWPATAVNKVSKK